MQYTKGGGMIMRGFFSLGNNSEGEKFATLANPKAHTLSRTHCPANAPRLC